MRELFALFLSKQEQESSAHLFSGAARARFRSRCRSRWRSCRISSLSATSLSSASGASFKFACEKLCRPNLSVRIVARTQDFFNISCFSLISLYALVLLSECHEWYAAPASACLRRGPCGCFAVRWWRSQRQHCAWTVSLHPPSNAEHEAGQAATVWPDRESNPAYQALVARVQPTAPLSRYISYFVT